MYIDLHTKNFIDSLWKIIEPQNENSIYFIKSCHTFSWFHWVYGMQNSWCNLIIILAETVWTTDQRSQIYLQINIWYLILEWQISLPTMHRVPNCFSKNDPEIEPVTLLSIFTYMLLLVCYLWYVSHLPCHSWHITC